VSRARGSLLADPVLLVALTIAVVALGLGVIVPVLPLLA
jgi:hypothetical protein